MPNITLSVDEEIIRKVRKIAVDRNTTLTQMVREYLNRVAEQQDAELEIACGELEDTFRAFARDLKLPRWNRNDLHER